MPEGGSEASDSRFVVERDGGPYAVIRDTLTGHLCMAGRGEEWAAEVTAYLNAWPCYAIHFDFGEALA